MADRVEQLRRAAQARHDATVARTIQALRAMAAGNDPITFRRVATFAGVSRSWLYREPQLRAEIERLRQSPHRSGPTGRPAQRATADSLRQQLHVYRAEIARLQDENRSLKDQLARQLGASRAAAITKRS